MARIELSNIDIDYLFSVNIYEILNIKHLQHA